MSLHHHIGLKGASPRCQISLILSISLLLISGGLAISFEPPGTNLLPFATSSGVGMAVVDMDQDGLDDMVHFANALEFQIDYQQENGAPFVRRSFGAVAGTAIWGVAVGDLDNNGFPDVVTGGRYEGIISYLAREQGDGFDRIHHDTNVFLQGINMVDIDGDGALDVFACHDEGENVKLLNDGSGRLIETPEAMDNGGHAGTYGSVWTDYDNDGDLDLYLSKCSVYAPHDPTDPRRINQLFRNEGDGNYAEVAVSAGLAFGEQSWAADFADIDNDGDLDCFVGNHVAFSKLMRNEGDGTFTDITDSSGVREFFNLIQCVFRDFDNDGWVDLLVTGELHRIWKNNGDATFTKIDLAIPSSVAIESCAVGDLNRDGFPDIYAGYAQIANFPRSEHPDQVFFAVPNENHFLSLSLRGVRSNRLGSGARVEAYGPWGVQVREVRSGESYGVTHSFTQTIGLGSENSVERLVVRWPSGIVDEFHNIAGDQFLTLEEGTRPIFALVEVGNQKSAIGTTCHCLMTLASPVPFSVNYSAEGLPSGLEIDSSTGLISGTPDGAQGTQTVTVTAAMGDLSDSETFEWEVIEVDEWLPIGVHVSSGEFSMAARSDGEVDATLALPPSTENRRYALQLSNDLSNWEDAGNPNSIALADHNQVGWHYEAISSRPLFQQLSYGFARFRVLTPAP